MNHRLSVALMVIALACSVTAGAIGFFTSAPSKVIAGLAVIPPLIAYVAVNLKFERKTSWHYRKRDALRVLRSKLLYQQPVSPSAENIASIAESWDELTVKMQAEWDADLGFNFRESLIIPPSNGSSAAPIPGPQGRATSKP